LLCFLCVWSDFSATAHLLAASLTDAFMYWRLHCAR